jgi:hypothetical protein
MPFDISKTRNLIPINKTEVLTYWHKIYPCLKFMVDANLNLGYWTPEMVFNSLLMERSSCIFLSSARPEKKRGRPSKTPELKLYETREEAIDDSCGIAIAQINETPDGKTFHVWITVSNESTNKKDAPPIFLTFRKELEELATLCNCNRVSFTSNNDWWETVAPRFDLKKQETIYVMEIKNDH